MLTLLGGRARAQWQLLVSLLAVVTVGTTLLGVCTLLVTRTAEQALEVAASRAAPEETEVTAYTVQVAGADTGTVAADTRELLTATLAPFRAETAARAASVMREFRAGGEAAGYLGAVDNLPARADLQSGRWPQAPTETVVLESTARMLGLEAGSRVRLGPEIIGKRVPGVPLTVVGVIRPRPGTGWDRDPLAGAGYDMTYRDGSMRQAAPTYGPFLLRFEDLVASGSALGRMEITARPDLSAPDRADLDAVTTAVVQADGRLARILGDRVQLQRVGSAWPATMLAARDQQQVTNGAVLAIAVLGLVLTGTALALAGRLTADVRAGETALLSAMGTGPGRLALVATAEAAALALVAAAVAIPGSALLHSLLSHLQPMAGAGLSTAPAVTAAQVAAVLAGAVTLAVLLVVRAIRPAPATGERTRRDLLARSGTDVLLVALAAGGWWQLRSQPGGSAPQVDAVRVLAPALLLIAGAALALRLVPPALAAADRLARRAGGLSLPLAVAEAARRPQATAAGLLVALACAAGSFGIAFDATWTRSQHDQADLAVGTDLALALAAPPDAAQGAAVQEATGGTVSPATDRGMSIGQWLGGAGDPPRLVAVDATRAGDVLRGRLDGGRTWASVGDAIAAPQRVEGLRVGGPVTLTGRVEGVELLVTPRLVLEDATGLRTICTAASLRLDGRPHRLPACANEKGVRLVAVALPFTGESIGWEASGSSEVSVTLAVPTADTGGWTATSTPPEAGQLLSPAVALTPDGTTTRIRMSTTVQLGGPDAARTLVASAFADPGPVPVAISQRFADEIGSGPGDRLDVAVDTTAVPLVVTDVVPAIPSAPGAVAALADLDTLSRALILRGDLDSPVDAWWVGDPSSGADGLHLGAATTRAGEIDRLSSGPVPAVLPAVLRLLVPAALLLLVAGIVLHVTCDLRARAVEVARLRGLGMTRRQVRRTLLGQHAVVLLPMVLAGALVGALGTRLVAPLLVRSATGAEPVPSVVPLWPWAAEALLVAVVLAVCTLAVSVVVVLQAARADAAHLRVAS